MRQQQRQQLSAFIERTHHGKASKRTSLELGSPDPQQHFSPERHALSAEECRIANALLKKAERQRPLHGTPLQQRFKFALRCGGILSAVKQGRAGSTKFGHHLMAYKGGNAMKAHGLHILKEIGPVGSLTARLNREGRLAADFWEGTGEVLAPGERPAHSPEERRIQSLITQWEELEWRAQQDRLGW